jgi:hypothetical protein
MNTATSRGWWPVVLVAAALLMITMGARQSMGLFVSPINTSTGLGIVSISFALAVGQFVWGLAQPIAGACADRLPALAPTSTARRACSPLALC